MTDDLEETVAELVRRVAHRHLGKYRGTVEHNDDPKELGRVRVRVPSVLGDEVVSGWAWPCAAFGGAAGRGLWAIPEVGAGVWVEFEEGDPEFPIWVGTFWGRPGGTTEIPVTRDREGKEGSATAPTRLVLTTAAGHTLQIEDGGEDLVLLHQEAQQRTIALDRTGIRIADGAGNVLEMTDDAFTLHSATTFTIDAPGQQVEIKAKSIELTRSENP